MPRYKSQSQYNALCLVITVSVLVWLISRFCLQNSRKFTRSILSSVKLGDHSLLISPLSQMYTYPDLRGFFKPMFSFVKKRDRGKIYTYFLKYEHVKLFPWLRVNSITSPKTLTGVSRTQKKRIIFFCFLIKMPRHLAAHIKYALRIFHGLHFNSVKIMKHRVIIWTTSLSPKPSDAKFT